MHHSSPFIDQVGDFTVNAPRSGQAAEVDYCGTVSGAEDRDKCGTCGWTLVPSTHILSPHIAKCPIDLECRVIDRILRTTNTTYLAEIVQTHVDGELLDESNCVDALALDPLIWTPDGNYYRLGAVVGREARRARQAGDADARRPAHAEPTLAQVQPNRRFAPPRSGPAASSGTQAV